jgi:hypothetical protein
MKILSIGKSITYNGLDITSIDYPTEGIDFMLYDYLIISGGDGLIRRVLNFCYSLPKVPKIILNPIGSFNVVAKIHRVKKVSNILQKLLNGDSIIVKKQKIFKLNSEIFLFSAGNMGDLQHILLSETLRFGILKKGMSKYIISFIFLIPVHIIMTPFMFSSSKRFLIFPPFKFIKKFGSFYGQVDNIKIDLDNEYNMLELDGDIVTIKERYLEIKEVGEVEILAR